jgi:predicted dehydrogenase
MFRAMIVGCGKIAGIDSSANNNTHAGALKVESRIELVAVVDCDYKKALRFAGQYKCNAFEDLKFALDEITPDLVSICTPDPTHFEVAKTTLLASKPPKIIFLEKPACFLEKEYKELVNLAADKNVVVIINHSRRFNPKYLALRNLILSGSLGLLARVNATYYSGWFHNGTHIIDTLAYLLDDRMDWCRLDDVIVSPYLGDETLELTGRLIKSDAKVVISAVDEALYQIFEFDFWFQKGRIRIEDFGSRISLEKKIINQLGESVLQELEINLPIAERSEMEIAIGLICDSFEGKDPQKLKCLTVEAILPTMSSLWQGRDLFLNKREANES